MGCGNSKDGKQLPNGQAKVVSNASQVQNQKNQTATAMNANAWDHPAPMKSPYPQGKPDEVLSRMKDADLVMNDNVPVTGEIVPDQMVGKVVKESYAVKEGYVYQTLIK